MDRRKNARRLRVIDPAGLPHGSYWLISAADLRVLDRALRALRRDHAGVVGRCSCIFCEDGARRMEGEKR